jgi:hypothetical protein
MKPVIVADKYGDSASVKEVGTGTVHLEASYLEPGRERAEHTVLLTLTPEAARQLGLALIAFSLEAERE